MPIGDIISNIKGYRGKPVQIFTILLFIFIIFFIVVSIIGILYNNFLMESFQQKAAESSNCYSFATVSLKDNTSNSIIKTFNDKLYINAYIVLVERYKIKDDTLTTDGTNNQTDLTKILNIVNGYIGAINSTDTNAKTLYEEQYKINNLKMETSKEDEVRLECTSNILGKENVVCSIFVTKGKNESTGGIFLMKTEVSKTNELKTKELDTNDIYMEQTFIKENIIKDCDKMGTKEQMNIGGLYVLGVVILLLSIALLVSFFVAT